MFPNAFNAFRENAMLFLALAAVLVVAEFIGLNVFTSSPTTIGFAGSIA